MKTIFYTIAEFDLAAFLKKTWYDIHPCYKKSFFVIFVALNATFLFFLMQNMPGREDWDEQIRKVSFVGYLYIGRYFTLIWTVLLLAAAAGIIIHELRQNIPIAKRIMNIALESAVLFLALFLSLVTSLLSLLPEFYAPRIDFFGIGFFHIIILAILFHSQTKMIFKSSAIVGCALIIVK